MEIKKCKEEDDLGGKMIYNLANNINVEFPDLKGFSPRNLKYIRRFAEEYKEIEFVQQVVAQIPWYHNIHYLYPNNSPHLGNKYVHNSFLK